MAASSGSHRRRDPKQRLKQSLPALLVVCFVIFAGGALIQIDSVSPGRLDTGAAKRIREHCGPDPHCTLRLGDLIPGDWDTFYEFSPSVNRTEIDTVLKQPMIRTAPRQRVLVLMHNGHILRRQYAHTGQTEPLAGEIVFRAAHASSEHSWVAFPPQTLFNVLACATAEGGAPFGHHGGIYFLLTPVPLSAGRNCPEELIRGQ